MSLEIGFQVTFVGSFTWPGSGFPWGGQDTLLDVTGVLQLPLWSARSRESELRASRMHFQVLDPGEAVGAPRTSMGTSNLVDHLSCL